MMVAKRKIAFHPDHRGGCGSYPVLIEPAMPLTPPKTVRRNARERNRVKQIDQGFDKLKSNIPCAAAQKKISRVRILQTAVDYIQHLHAVLNEHESVCSKGPVVKQEPIMSGGASGRGESGGCLSPLAAGMPPTPARSPPKPLLHGGSAAAAALGTAQMMTMPMPYQGYPHHQHLPFPAAGSPYPPPPPLHHYNHHHFHHHHSPMNVHSPISPYASSSAASSALSPAAFDTSSLASSGYYSSHLQGSSPGSLRSSGSREHFFQSPKSSGGHNVSSGLLLSPDGGGDFPNGGCRESLSPSSSSYSDTSLPTPSYQGQQQQQQVPCTQDPTPSTTFHEDDEDILNSIIQWEKY